MWVALLLADAADQGGPPGYSIWFLVLPLVLLYFFIVFGPSRKQKQQHQAMLAALKKGDRILNSGGIIGVVEEVKKDKDEIVLRGGLRITKSSVLQVVTEESAKEQ